MWQNKKNMERRMKKNDKYKLVLDKLDCLDEIVHELIAIIRWLKLKENK